MPCSQACFKASPPQGWYNKCSAFECWMGVPPALGEKTWVLCFTLPPFFSVSVMALKGVEATPLFKFLVTALEGIMRICQFLGRGFLILFSPRFQSRAEPADLIINCLSRIIFQNFSLKSSGLSLNSFGNISWSSSLLSSFSPARSVKFFISRAEISSKNSLAIFCRK